MIRGLFSYVKRSFSFLYSPKYAIVTNTLTGSALFVIGDAIEQKIEYSNGLKSNKALDHERLKRIGLVGLSKGIPNHFFYKYLDIAFPGAGARNVFKKILMDQLIACPLFNLQFFIGMAWLEGKSEKECWDEFVKKFPTVYLLDWIIWPPCQLINFWLVPQKYRVLYVNSLTVFWNVFLSYMKHYDQYEQPQLKNNNKVEEEEGSKEKRKER